MIFPKMTRRDIPPLWVPFLASGRSTQLKASTSGPMLALMRSSKPHERICVAELLSYHADSDVQFELILFPADIRLIFPNEMFSVSSVEYPTMEERERGDLSWSLSLQQLIAGCPIQINFFHSSLS